MGREAERLAIHGGCPVRQQPWPKWPRADECTEGALLDVLHCGRWTISGMYPGTELFERRFARAFAEFNGARYCVPTTSGTAALTIALEALNVGSGDEVLVPGVTWVACASAVANLGAVPVLTDVEPQTLCMSVDAAKSAINERTRAILLVHLYCSIADLDGFLALSRDSGIPLLEDCAQAHGAVFRGKRVGTFGRLGTFSFQDSKVMTSGEGGAVITDDENLYLQLQQFRADGRAYRQASPTPGHPELEEIGDVQGRNLCLSEFQAAILLDRLGHLEEENRTREANAEYLRGLLSNIGGITSLLRRDGVHATTYYQFCVRLDLSTFGNANIEEIRQALMGELRVFCEPVDEPLNDNRLYNPLASPQKFSPSLREALKPSRFHLPVATTASRECLTLPHKVLLGDRADVEDVAEAFAKIKGYFRSHQAQRGPER